MPDLRTLENDSIRAFVQSAADEGYLSGRVLDWGCGLSPYQDIVQGVGGSYEGFDSSEHPGNVGGVTCGIDLFWDANAWDAILCTQVIQYVPLVSDFIGDLHERLFKGGHLVMTYPTNWPEVEPEDLHRFTKAGMTRLLTEAGFEVVLHEERARIAWGRVSMLDEFALGYGVVARA